jgi:P4 family phage/plasmid primase-like protien
VSGRGAPGSWAYLALWDGQDIDLDATLAELPCHDFAAAKLLRAERPDELHYVPPTISTWHIWDGQCHRPDDGGKHARVVLDLADRYKIALGKCQEALVAEVMAVFPANQVDAEVEARWKLWEPAVKYAAGLCKTPGVSNLKTMLADVCSVSPAYLEDQHPEWLCHALGTTDLRTGATWPHRPSDLLTYCLPVAPGRVWDCPKFAAMVHHVAGGNDAVAQYLMRVLGYALIGDNREQQIFFLNGPTKSGKSQLLTIVRKLLSVLGHESKAALITHTPHGRNARIENSIRGMRLITINETQAIMHIEEGQLKRLTGETEIAVDQHYNKMLITTKVSFVIIIATNEMPSVASMDPAISERVIVIPCGQTIPPEYRIKGYADQILAEEAPGILATLMHYAGAYLAESKIPMPREVREATELYCSLQNVAAQFAADKLACGLGWEQAIPGHVLWKSAQEWARDDRKLPGRNQFYEMLGQLEGVTRTTVSEQPVFRGVSWKIEIPSIWQ